MSLSMEFAVAFSGIFWHDSASQNSDVCEKHSDSDFFYHLVKIVSEETQRLVNKFMQFGLESTMLQNAKPAIHITRVVDSLR